LGWVFHISLIAASKAEQSFGVGGQAPIVLALAPGCLRNYRIPLKADQEVIVCSEAKGTVEALPVDLGSEVRRRQVLARLAQREAPLRVDQARLGLLNGDSHLEAERNSDVRQAKAALDEARLRYQRAKTLIQNRGISQERFDEAETQHRSAEARYQAALENFHNQTALVEQRAAELQLARKQLQDTVILAPMDGAVSARHVTRGVYSRRGTGRNARTLETAAVALRST